MLLVVETRLQIYISCDEMHNIHFTNDMQSTYIFTIFILKERECIFCCEEAVNSSVNDSPLRLILFIVQHINFLYHRSNLWYFLTTDYCNLKRSVMYYLTCSTVELMCSHCFHITKHVSLYLIIQFIGIQCSHLLEWNVNYYELSV